MLPDPAADLVTLPVSPEELPGFLAAEGDQPGIGAIQPFRRGRAPLKQLPQAADLGSPTATSRCSPAVPGSPDAAEARTAPGAMGPAGRNSAASCRALPAIQRRPTMDSFRRPGDKTRTVNRAVSTARSSS